MPARRERSLQNFLCFALWNNEQPWRAGLPPGLIDRLFDGNAQQLSRPRIKIDGANVADPARIEFGFDPEDSEHFRDARLQTKCLRSRGALRLFFHDPETNAKALQLERQRQTDRAGADDHHFAVHRAISSRWRWKNNPGPRRCYIPAPT